MRSAKVVVLLLAVIFVVIAAFGSDTKFAFLTTGGGGVESPDGKYVIRDFQAKEDAPGFVRNQRTLVVEEHSTGRSWSVCEHMGQVSVAWGTDGLIAVNDFFNARGARTLLFKAGQKSGHILINASTLAAVLPDDVASHLTANDHVFVQAYKLDGNVVGLRAWGFGALDPKGFKLVCDYKLEGGIASCRNEPER